MQRLQDPHQINRDNLNSTRHEANRHSRNMWGNKGNITELERNSKNRSMRNLYTGINGFKDV